VNPTDSPPPPGDDDPDQLLERIIQAMRDAEGPRFDAAASFARIQSRLGQAPRVTPGRGTHIMFERSPGTRLGVIVAAGLGLAAAVVIGLSVVARGRTAGVDHVYTTAAGERADLHLTDGTHVVLAPASRLTVLGNYGTRRRAVTLDGEAFFTVRHDASVPFTVRAGQVVATDVGTSFDVTAYGGDTAVRVAVTDGRVALASGALPTVPLIAGDLASVGSRGVPTVAHHADVMGLTHWTDGRLEFHDVPLRDALPALARWYGLDLVLGDSTLGSVPLTASFRDEPVTEVLHIVAVTVGARVVHRETTTVLLPRATPARTP
jgi:ferric-dicitrate binding protein FerR (iron transport regulator)